MPKDKDPGAGYERGAPLPDLTKLHERHNITEPVCGGFAEAAAVCFSRHHRPAIDVEVSRPDGAPVVRSLNWVLPNEVVRATWGNRDDTTRDAAYAISLAAVEIEAGLVARSRADIRTGADWYVGAPGDPSDLEDALRLEVSGVDAGDRRAITSRVRSKLKQLAAGSSDKLGLVCVVGFLERLVVIRRMKDSEEE